MSSQRDTWIIVCTNFHGAVGPIPTEQLAVHLAASASALGECNYQPVRLALASVPQRATRRPEGDSPLIGTGRLGIDPGTRSVSPQRDVVTERTTTGGVLAMQGRSDRPAW